MRKHISKAIVRRSSAIRTALDKYNHLASLQTPPCPTLQYADVAGYTWLGDFDLLKGSRHDILSEPWAMPSNREYATKHFKVLRAKEEIVRLNVETRRLHAWIDDEDQQLQSASQASLATDPFLSRELQRRCWERSRVNDVHRLRLRAIYSLAGYSGPGPHIQGQIVAAPSEDNATAVNEELNGGMTIGAEEDDTVSDEVLRLEDCLDNIA